MLPWLFHRRSFLHYNRDLEPRLLLLAVDVQEATPVVFDSYEKEDGTRKTEYGKYGKMKSDGSAKNPENEAYEHVI